jgi:molybdopterin molybdotransferase
VNKEHGLRFGRNAISVEAARGLLAQHMYEVEPEKVPLALAFGRRVAQRIYADHAVPHFRRSGVDGYAVRATDIKGATYEQPIELTVIEHIPSGTVPVNIIEPGTAARIMTGAPVPDGADVVVMLEMTDTQDAGGQAVRTLIHKELPPGRNITPIAGEIEEGELLLERGTRIGAGEAALLATFGHGTVSVYKKPRVAIFSTGSELLNVEERLQPGRIRNSNSYMLAAQVESAGGLPTIGTALSDNVNQVQEALIKAFEAYDLVITSGGVSVGDYDVLVDLFGRWDGRLLFNKVAMRPGSPTSAALWQSKLLLALSGNPGASFVGFELFARPLLDAMQGSKNPFPKANSAFLDVDYDKGSAHPRYVRGTTRIEDGRLLVRPAGADKSSIMVSIKDADCLILLPAGGSGFAKGECVSIFFLADR